MLLRFNSFLASGNFSFANKLCKQFGPRSGQTVCRSGSGSKLFDSDSVPERIF